MVLRVRVADAIRLLTDLLKKHVDHDELHTWLLAISMRTSTVIGRPPTNTRR